MRTVRTKTDRSFIYFHRFSFSFFIFQLVGSVNTFEIEFRRRRFSFITILLGSSLPLSLMVSNRPIF